MAASTWAGDTLLMKIMSSRVDSACIVNGTVRDRKVRAEVGDHGYRPSGGSAGIMAPTP
jgi:hypothetical protein